MLSFSVFIQGIQAWRRNGGRLSRSQAALIGVSCLPIALVTGYCIRLIEDEGRRKREAAVRERAMIDAILDAEAELQAEKKANW